MLSKHALFSAFLLPLMLLSVARSEQGERDSFFTLQVAAFPDRGLADKFIAGLSAGGEKPFWGTVELPGRGKWIRVFIGSFETLSAARRYGEGLVRRGLIEEFLVRSAAEIKSLGRPRTIGLKPVTYSSRPATALPKLASRRSRLYESLRLRSKPVAPLMPAVQANLSRSEAARPLSNLDAAFVSMLGNPVATSSTGIGESEGLSLTRPPNGGIDISFAPPVDLAEIPRADPVRVAFKVIGNEWRVREASSPKRGGLWVSGDTGEALARLRWIAGLKHAEIVTLDNSGQVHLDAALLAKTMGLDQAIPMTASFLAADYISSNEGLLLLVQVTQGSRRYRLHIGRQTPTLGAQVAVGGSINLDNNFDSRINPYRRAGRKLDIERPPQGFDSLIAINPIARWFNLHTNRLVPVAHITFHELAEAHAKLDLELDYLAQGSSPGAHNIALEREKRLKSQRPFSDVVVTVGANRVLRTEQEVRLFLAEIGIAAEGAR